MKNLNAIHEVLTQVVGELIDEKLPLGYTPKDVEFKISVGSLDPKVRVKVNLYPLIFTLDSQRGEI